MFERFIQNGNEPKYLSGKGKKDKNKKRVHFNGIGRIIDKKFLVIEKK